MKWIGNFDMSLADITSIVAGTGLSGGWRTGSGTLNVDASIPEITTLAGLTSFGSAGATTNIVAGDLTMYNPVTDGNPTIEIGVDTNECLVIGMNYQSGTQSAQQAFYSTKTASGTADDGMHSFVVDGSNILDVRDGGIYFRANKGISIAGTDILTDSSGTATLSNIDALDATTEATIEAAIDTLNDSITIDTDRSAAHGQARAENITALHVDFDREAPESGTYAHNDRGIDLDVTSASLGTSSLYGMDIDVVGAVSGTSTAYGIHLDVDGADTNMGMVINTAGTHLKLEANEDVNDYATFTLADTGDLTIATVGSGTRDSDLTLDADGDIKLEPASGNSIVMDTDNLALSSSTSAKPYITITATHTDKDQSGELRFVKDAADTEDGENLGSINFYGEDEGNNQTRFAGITAEISESDETDEAGKLTLFVTESDGTTASSAPGLILEGEHATDGEVDVTIANGAASTTTIAGTLTMGSTAALTNAGLVAVANQSNITGLGTISSGVWNGTAITSAYLDADTMHYSAQRQLTHHMIKDDIGTGVIYISLGEIDAESGTKSNKNLPLLAPVAGKLLKVFLRTEEDMSGTGHDTNLTWRLYTRAASATTGGNASIIGTQTGAGPTDSSMVTYDFTSSLDSGTNVIAAGDKVQLSVQSDAASADGLFFITCLWEWDLS